MHVREATMADAAEIKSELLRPAFRADERLDPEFNELSETGVESAGCEYWLDDDDRTMFVAERDGELVAQISAGLAEAPPIYERGPRAHVDGLYVKEAHRRNGIATSLIERVEEWAQANGCDTLGISVHTDNEEARELYEQDFDRTFLSYRRPVE